MMSSTALSNEIIDVSLAIMDDFPASYFLLIETPLYQFSNETTISNDDYEDYLESIGLQLLVLYDMSLRD